MGNNDEREKRKGNLRLNVEIEENGPDIMIQEKEEYVQFKIKDQKVLEN